MITRHDNIYPECPGAEPVLLLPRPGGEDIYKCRHCNYVQTLKGFKIPSHINRVRK